MHSGCRIYRGGGKLNGANAVSFVVVKARFGDKHVIKIGQFGHMYRVALNIVSTTFFCSYVVNNTIFMFEETVVFCIYSCNHIVYVLLSKLNIL